MDELLVSLNGVSRYYAEADTRRQHFAMCLAK